MKEWPVVEFQNGVTTPVFAHCEGNELGIEEPYFLLARVQVPLTPAWAITIVSCIDRNAARCKLTFKQHKSQGMTLNKVIVDLARSFERGMVRLPTLSND